MANHKSALKRVRTSEKKRLRNRQVRSRMRTEIKKATTAVQQGDVADARDKILQAVSQLDKAASKGVIHPNNAARRKSRLMKRLHALEAQQ